MREVVRAGATVAEAVRAALEELGVGPDRLTVEVLDEGRGGVLWRLGARDAWVWVMVRLTAAEAAREFLGRVGELIGLAVRVQAQEADGSVVAEVAGGDVGVLIGRQGEALAALELLGAMAVRRACGEARVVRVDVDGYRGRREEALRSLARRAVRLGREVALRPMTARERWVAHLALAHYLGVRTGSRGEEPLRRVVIPLLRRGESGWSAGARGFPGARRFGGGEGCAAG